MKEAKCSKQNVHEEKSKNHAMCRSEAAMAIASVKLPSKKFYLIGDILFVIAKMLLSVLYVKSTWCCNFFCEKHLVLQFL